MCIRDSHQPDKTDNKNWHPNQEHHWAPELVDLRCNKTIQQGFEQQQQQQHQRQQQQQQHATTTQNSPSKNASNMANLKIYVLEPDWYVYDSINSTTNRIISIKWRWRRVAIFLFKQRTLFYTIIHFYIYTCKHTWKKYDISDSYEFQTTTDAQNRNTKSTWRRYFESGSRICSGNATKCNY